MNKSSTKNILVLAALVLVLMPGAAFAQNFQATETTTSRIRLSWSPVPDTASYRVAWTSDIALRNSSGEWFNSPDAESSSNLGPTTSTYLLTNLPAATEYFIALVRTPVSGSPTVYTVTAETDAPDIGLRVAGADDFSVSLEWNDIGAANGYTIYYWTASRSQAVNAGTVPPGADNFRVTNLDADTAYTFRLKANDPNYSLTADVSATTEPDSTAPPAGTGTGSPGLSSGGNTGTPTPPAASGGNTGFQNPPLPSGGNTRSGGVFYLQNPLNPRFNSVGGIVQGFLEIFSYLVVLFAVLAIIWVGLQFVLSRGDTKRMNELKDWLLWIVVGVAIVIGARIIVTVVINTLQATGTVNQSVIQNANNALPR